jgi:hypothetical protein
MLVALQGHAQQQADGTAAAHLVFDDKAARIVRTAAFGLLAMRATMDLLGCFRGVLTRDPA